MNSTGIIDQFLSTFTTYIDSGFGLLKGDVGFIASTLIVIDVTLAALFWSWGADENIMAKLVKKTLFVGFFAYLINNWNNLAQIVFQSFSGLGLEAAGSSLSATEFLQPGRIAQVGLDAGRPLLSSISGLMGYVSFFENFIQIAVLLFAWVLVLLAFFILAVQLFVTLIEFKLTTLAGFVLIPFGLFGKSAFIAERVLGNVVASGIKVLVLAVIVGIGSTLFTQFTTNSSTTPTIDDAMAIVLAALSLLGLGIFGPGIANGLIAGGPQLGAGAAISTTLAGGGIAAGGIAAAGAAASGGAAMIGGIGAAARGGASLAGGATAAYGLGAEGKTGAQAVAGGLGNVASAGTRAAVSPLRRAMARTAEGLKNSYQAGSAAVTGSGDRAAAAEPAAADLGPTGDGPPAWAARMRRNQRITHATQTTVQAVRSGDAHGGGHSVDLSEGE